MAGIAAATSGIGARQSHAQQVPKPAAGPSRASTVLRPAWRKNAAPFKWINIPGTKFVDAVGLEKHKGYSAQAIDAWCGTCIDAKGRVLSVAGGGHNTNGWPYGATVVVDLTADVPRWKLESPLTSNADIPSMEISEKVQAHHFYDGRPSSTHHYHMLAYLNRTKQAVMPWQPVPYGGNAYAWRGSTFYDDVNKDFIRNGKWDCTRAEFIAGKKADGSVPQWIPNADAMFYGEFSTWAGTCCKHPDTEVLYLTAYGIISGKWGAWIFDPFKRISIKVGDSYGPMWCDVGTCIDTKRNLWCAAASLEYGNAVGSPVKHTIWRRDLTPLGVGVDPNANLGHRTPLKVTGLEGEPDWQFGNALHIDPNSGDYIVVSGIFGRVYAINPETGAGRILSTDHLNPPSRGNPLGYRVNMAPMFGGIFCIERGDSNVKFMALVE